MTPRFNQIALSVRDRHASSAFYADVFGMPMVGATTFKGKTTEAVQGLAGAHSNVIWHMDDRDFFQLELFEFETPEPRDAAAQRKPADIGYSRIAFEVADLDAVRLAAVKHGARQIGNLHEIAGRRFFTARDPNGILIEVGEPATPLPDGQPARLAGIALTVPNLNTGLASFSKTIGCPVVNTDLSAKGVLWGETQGPARSALLDGGTIWLELNEYPQGAGRPWPDGYRISDIGILNVALGFRSSKDIAEQFTRLCAAGFRPNCTPAGAKGLVQVTYLTDPAGFSVELLMVTRAMDGAMGFRKANLFDRIIMTALKAAS